MYWVVAYEEMGQKFVHLENFTTLESAVIMRNKMIADGRHPNHCWVEQRPQDKVFYN
jgi:hypothetical protein